MVLSKTWHCALRNSKVGYPAPAPPGVLATTLSSSATLLHDTLLEDVRSFSSSTFLHTIPFTTLSITPPGGTFHPLQ